MRTVKITLTSILIPIYFNCMKAQSSADLDIGNIKARINSDGYLFRDTATSGAGSAKFEVPKGSGSHTIFTSNLWMGGLDAGSNLKLAAETYRQNGTDFWAGPLDTTNTSIDAPTSLQWNKVWKINKTSVDSCMLGLYAGNPPASILNWPAHGDIAKKQSQKLAPFYDKNKNGTYEPTSGDCPCVKGDQAVYFIYNDVKVHTETGGVPIGVEIHGMAYSFNTPADTALNNTVFVSYKVINRSAFNLNSFYIGTYTDLDNGNAFDDYIGSNVEKNFYYGYNGDNFDDDVSGDIGYHSKPPAQGVVFLKGPLADLGDGVDNDHNSSTDEAGETLAMSKFMYYNNDFTVVGNPSNADHYYTYMKGTWKDGTPATYGGDAYNESGPVCDYMFPGTSDPTGWGTAGVPQADWSESSVSNVPGDRRGVGSYGPFTFEAGKEVCIDFAYVFSQGSDRLASVAKLENDVDHVTNYFNENLAFCDFIAGNVWPGDANSDLVANNKDILNIGLGYNGTGPTRTNASNNWIGQVGTDWANTFPTNMGNNNYKHGDCNGDGSINADDTTAILQNYGEVHFKTEWINTASASDPVLYYTIPVDSIEVSTAITVPFYLGNMAIPANNIYGLAFSINYNSDLIDPASLRMSLNSSWLGTVGTDLIHIQYDEYQNGRLDVGITRTNHNNVSGYGHIGDLNFITIDNLSGKTVLTEDLTFTITDIKVIANNGNEQPINTGYDTVIVKQILGIKENAFIDKMIKVYPNPAHGVLNINVDQNLEVKEIVVTNMMGTVVEKIKKSDSNLLRINTTDYSSGIYFLIINTTNGTAVKRVTVINNH